MGKKMSDPKIDALFEKMSRETANKMNGTRPPVKKKAVSKKKVKNADATRDSMGIQVTGKPKKKTVKKGK